MASETARFPSTTVSANTGNAAWVTPNNAQADDGSTTEAPGDSDNAETDQLNCTNFGSSIPAGATIDGIEFECERHTSSQDIWTDRTVKCIKGGTVQGTDLSSGTLWTGSPVKETYGGALELWGLTWSVADINASTSGFSLTGNEQEDESGFIDYVSRIVHYTEAAGGGAALFKTHLHKMMAG